MTFVCRALFVSKDDLVDPKIVPWSPTWVVGFNTRFGPMDGDYSYYPDNDPGLVTGLAIEKWRDQNAESRIEIFGSGEVVCEDEADAMMLYMLFR